MPSDLDPRLDRAGVWAKKYFFASRALMDSVLRPFDLGLTQWHVLHRLIADGPLSQSEVVRELDVERATMSAVIGALVRKGLVEQEPHPTDQRSKVLAITDAGRALWASLPDPIDLIASVAFDGVSDADLETTRRVMLGATARLIDYKKEQRSQ